MNRRDFIGKGIGSGIIAGTALAFGNIGNIMGMNDPSKAYDLVAVKGGEAVRMFDRAIQSLGGMKAFVKPGQTVVVKPNIGWDKAPEMAANTNPQLVARIVEHCYTAGAKEVFVFDYTCDNWQKCYDNSGIADAVKTAKGKMMPGNNEQYYKPVSIAKGKRLKNAKEHELLQNAYVFINVPVLKNHGGATLSIAMKNLMGVIWDRGFYHSNDLHQCIADFVTYRKPDLNIIDAYRVMKQNGPKGVSTKDVVLMKSQIISTDIVAADAAAAKLLGFEPKDIPHIRIAHGMGVGSMDLEKLNINRIKM